MYSLRPPDEMVIEAVEEIDKVLTEYAMARVQGSRKALIFKAKEVFSLRLLLAEIKRLRKEQDEHKDETR